MVKISKIRITNPDPTENPNGLLESSGDNHEPLYLIHIEHVIYALVVAHLLCSFYLTYERFWISKCMKNRKPKAKMRHFPLSYGFLAILILMQTSNYNQQANRTLFSFGVESLYANKDLGGFYAILGYAYNLDYNSLDVCFHRVHQSAHRLDPNYHRGTPDKDAIYSPHEAIAFGVAASMPNKIQGRLTSH